MHTSPASRAPHRGGASFSDEAGHAPLRPNHDLADFFAEMATLFERWDEFTGKRKDAIMKRFIEDVLPYLYLPEEMLIEMERWFEGRADQ